MQDMARIRSKGPTRQLGVRLQQSLIDRAERYADLHHRTVTSVLEVALAEYLDRNEGKPAVEKSTFKFKLKRPSQ